MRKRTELSSKFLGDWWIKRKYEALWNFFYIYGNAEERKWNLSKKKFYWTNAGFCEDLLWTRNSALFGLLDLQHFLFGRFLISKLEGTFFNWELRKKFCFLCESTSCVCYSQCIPIESGGFKMLISRNSPQQICCSATLDKSELRPLSFSPSLLLAISGMMERCATKLLSFHCPPPPPTPSQGPSPPPPYTFTPTPLLFR